MPETRRFRDPYGSICECMRMADGRWRCVMRSDGWTEVRTCEDMNHARRWMASCGSSWTEV